MQGTAEYYIKRNGDAPFTLFAAFEADTGMSRTEAAEQPAEEYSDIISQMRVKSVSLS